MPWKPGESGNPDGPPKGHVKLAHWLRVYMQEGAKGLERAPDKAVEFIQKVVDREDPDAKLIFDRHDGLQTTKAEVAVKADVTQIVTGPKRPPHPPDVPGLEDEAPEA